MVVDRLHRGQYILREDVLRQRLAHPRGRSIDSRLAQCLQELAFRLGPNLHLDHGPLLSLQGLDEYQGVLVLDIILVEGQDLPLPAERTDLLKKRLFGRTQARFRQRLQHILEAEIPTAQRVRIKILEIVAQVPFPRQDGVVECLLAGLVPPEPSLGIGAQDGQVVLISDLFHFADVAKGRRGVDLDLAFLGGAENRIVKRFLFAVLGVRVIVDGQTVLAQVFEDLPLVDAVDLPVTTPQELLGMAVMVGDQPVDDVLPLNLLDVEGGEVREVQACEVEAVLEIGPPLLDGAEASVHTDGSDLHGVRIDEPPDLVGCLLSVGDELVTGPFHRLEEPAVTRFIGPELLAVRASDLRLARGREVS